MQSAKTPPPAHPKPPLKPFYKTLYGLKTTNGCPCSHPSGKTRLMRFLVRAHPALHLVLLFRILQRLPLHVAGVIRTPRTQRLDMIHHIPRTRPLGLPVRRARMRRLEIPLRRITPILPGIGYPTKQNGQHGQYEAATIHFLFSGKSNMPTRCTACSTPPPLFW